MRAAKYADPEMARRNLESLVAATLESSLLDVEGLGDDAPAAYALMDELADSARRAYRALVYETAGLRRRGSARRRRSPRSPSSTSAAGPPSRTASGRIEDLRAIPWVFSWSQSRIMLPGWYGTGTALADWVGDDADRLARLRDLHDRWPFLRTVLSNMDMVLAKSDLSIARRYAEPRPRPRAPRPGVRRDRRRARAVGGDGAGRHRAADPAGRQPGDGPQPAPPVPLRRRRSTTCRSSCCGAGGRATTTS